MNIELYKRVLSGIRAYPESWNQERWHSDCGTRHCFAGWVEILAGYEWDCEESHLTKLRAQAQLQLTDQQTRYLFDSTRTIKDFENFLDWELAIAERKALPVDRFYSQAPLKTKERVYEDEIRECAVG